MNKILIGIIILVLICLGGWFLFYNNVSVDEGAKVIMQDVKGINAERFGAYESYSPEKLKEIKDGEKVVLFFKASWCPTCRAADNEFKTDGIPNNVRILSVDYDNSAELKKKYGVTLQHTFVQVDKDGELITKWIGGGVGKLELSVK